MSRFIPTRRGNPCFCGNESGNCRQVESLHLCMTFTDATSAAAVPGYKFIGQTKDRLWGQFVEDNRSDWTEQQRQEWRQQQEFKRRQREVEEAKRRSSALPAVERDRHYRKLLEQLTLHSSAREDLKRRGLTDEQIAAGGFKSVEQWQKFDLELPHQLPGVNLDGLSLNTQPGYLCPIKDVDGLIVGCQIRLRDSDAGRYRWLTSKTTKRPNGATPHLPNGELPLAVHRPLEVKSSSIGLTEGTGVKPFLAAQRLGQVTIGAAGGQFAASPQTLKATLEQLGSKTINFYPDAGAIANRNVIRQYEATWELLEQWGYQVNIGWWGQVDKTHADIDQLEDTSAIAYITPEEFLEMASAYIPKLSRRDRTLSANDWQWEFGLPNWFRSQIAKLPKVFKGFGQAPELKPVASVEPSAQPQIVQYVPGKLPTPEQYKAIGNPKIRFKQGERLQLIAELVPLGYHDILDASGTGTSKSHDAGLVEPGRFGVDRLLYFSEDHRNPTTATVEANYTDMPVRHDGRESGLVEDSMRRTALGKPYQRWARRGEKPTVTGNCTEVKKFHLFANKGYKQAETTAQINPICDSCQWSWNCGNKEEARPGHNFRALRAEAWESSRRIRLSKNSAPDPESLVAEKNGAFWDEAMRQLLPTETVEARLDDFDRMWAELEFRLPEIHNQLKLVRSVLRPIVAGEIKPTQATYHGWNDAAVRSLLGAAPDSLVDIVDQLLAIQPNLQEILAEPDRIGLQDNPDASKVAVKSINKLLRQENNRNVRQELENLPSNWLVPFLEVWAGLRDGVLRLNKGALTVTSYNRRYARIAKAMKFNIYLDATAKRDYLALYLGIDSTDIVEIEQQPADFSNLTIVQVTGLGLLGHERSDSLKNRTIALKTEFNNRHNDIGFIEHKERAEAGKGWWFNHNRGSNEYKDCSALASFGIPYQNIGALQDLYIILTGDRNVDKDASGFSAFVQWQTQVEIAQAPGRLRANLRPKEQVTYYFCADFDLEFLQEFYPGATIKQESAFSITPAAGTETEQTCGRILEGVRQLLQEAGVSLEKLRQTAVAQITGVSQGRISQVAAECGGWAAYKKLLAVLLESPYRDANNFELLDRDQQFIADTHLPIAAKEDPPDAIQAMLFAVGVYGWRKFRAILAATPIATQGKLLAVLISGLPPNLQEEFRGERKISGEVGDN